MWKWGVVTPPTPLPPRHNVDGDVTIPRALSKIRSDLKANSGLIFPSRCLNTTNLVSQLLDLVSKFITNCLLKNGVNPHAPNPSTNSNFTPLSVLRRERLTSPNYMDWMRNLRFTLRYEKKEYVLDEKIPTINDDST
ncbi:hypothetical protein Tco_0320598 [Tanacetum coccineum]